MAVELSTKETEILSKTKELCETIVAEPQFRTLLDSVEAFMNDPAARTLYEKVSELQQNLSTKQESGEQLADEDINGFEKQRDLLLENPVASAFMDARQQIYDVQDTISTYVSKTFELGRVPMDEELKSGGGGCCGGGGGGGGCGCH